MNTDDFQAPPPGRADSGLNAADRWADEPQTTFASPSVTVESAHKAMAAGSSTTNATATDALATGSAGEHHTENPWGSPESVPSDHEGASDTEDQVDWAQEEDERRDVCDIPSLVGIHRPIYPGYQRELPADNIAGDRVDGDLRQAHRF
jgi:hypothetical protein